MTTISLLDLQTLLDLGNTGTLTIYFFLGSGMRLFSQRQTLLLRLKTHFTVLDALLGQPHKRLPARIVSGQFFCLRLPMRLIVRQLCQPAFVFALRLAPMTYLGFQPGNLGIGGE